MGFKPAKYFFDKHYKKAILILSLFCALAANGQKAGKKREITVLPVPAIGYSPETKTYIGAVTLFTIKNLNDTLTRTSNAEVEFNYTWNKQVIFESGWSYFTPGETWFSRGLLHFSKYPDLFYGIGFNTPEYAETRFESNRVNLEFDVLKNIGYANFLGAGLNFTSYSNLTLAEENTTLTNLNKSNFGIKAIYLHDSRNSILSPNKGRFFEWNNSFNFSSTAYFKISADYRNYFNWGEKAVHVLAGRLFHSSVFGNPPFYDFPMVGGDEYLRGYYLGRFRDKNLSVLQLEYRARLFWRVGIAAFGGAALIYDSPGNIQNESFKPNGGIGLRFLVDKNENTNLRIDYAIGAQNQSGFYISFGESF